MKDFIKKKVALDYHSKPTPGKIAIVPTKSYSTQRDLSLAYSPGVAEPCIEIDKDPSLAYEYTSKGNTVAVISNGTAVLGLGNIGAIASKPVMEGKALLFKIFADIDGIDIEMDTTDLEKFIETVKIISPTFGGINLEDIKSPEAFIIEKRLKEELDIPVMHDDQHGTAIISAAALINALEIVEKKIDAIRLVINGAGAAAISCARIYKSIGIKPQNIVMLDSKGVLNSERESLTEEKLEFITQRKINNLEEAIADADVFIGLSVADILTPEMLLSMRQNPIVFALANPNPEIDYQKAIDTRDDIIMATGRSDYPNQVNNVLGFPFIFRGALDVRAVTINEEMKLAAVYALAELTKKRVPKQVKFTYNDTSMKFGKNYIIPKPFDPRLITEIPMKVAQAAMESNVAKNPIQDWEAYRASLNKRLYSDDKKIVRLIQRRAKLNPKRVVFPDADQPDVLKAIQIAHDEGICIPILLGDEAKIKHLKKEYFFESELSIIDPKSNSHESLHKKYAEAYWKSRARKGISYNEASLRMRFRDYFACMMVNCGDADAVLTGYTRNYTNSLRAIMSVIEPSKKNQKIASTTVMFTKRGPVFFSDTSININPSWEEIVDITIHAYNLVKLFGLDPIIALLSYSNFGTSDSPFAKKMKKAVTYIHENYPRIVVDGEIQSDFALNKDLSHKLFPFSKISNKAVNTLIFPNLDASNIAYKLMKELDNIEQIGPILMGLSKPVHVLQMNASINEIVNMIAVSVIDAQFREKQ